jgi:predicted metal-dependent phosphoesterase TrpH
MILRFESHTHTNFSDGTLYKLMIRTAIKKRIDVLAVTDHNTQEGYTFCVRYAEKCARLNIGSIFILPSEEVGCQGGDILAYGISEAIKKRCEMCETVDKIHDQGGLAVIAHPFNLFESISTSAIMKCDFDGIEIPNYNSFDLSKILARKFANSRPSLFQIGGSDAHHPWDLGIVLNLVEASLETDSILKALKKKRFRVIQRTPTFPWRAYYYLKNNIPNGFNIIRTGMKYQISWLYKKHYLRHISRT